MIASEIIKEYSRGPERSKERNIKRRCVSYLGLDLSCAAPCPSMLRLHHVCLTTSLFSNKYRTPQQLKNREIFAMELGFTRDGYPALAEWVSRDPDYETLSSEGTIARSAQHLEPPKQARRHRRKAR